MQPDVPQRAGVRKAGVARMERSAIRVSHARQSSPGFRCAPSGLLAPALSYYPDGLVLLCARILVEPRNGARPCLFGRGLVVAFGRGVVEEAMHGIRIDVAFEADVVFLQLRFLRGIGIRQVLIERAVV